MRRSADALKKPTYVEDKDSGELRRPHHIDLKAGTYKGRPIYNHVQLPDEGPTPSREEEFALRHAEAAEATRKGRERSDAARFR